MFRILCFCLLPLLVVSCQESDASQKTTSTQNVTAPSTSQKATYPQVPNDRLQSVWDQCDYVDFIFYNLPISLNRSKPDDIRNSITHIGQSPAQINPNCKALGRMAFFQNGNIALEADFYFSQGCSYFVFMEKNKPVYANVMSPGGIAFFNDVLSRVTQRNQ